MDDAELIQFAADFRDGILDGTPSAMTCAMVCEPLVTLLNMSGIHCSIAMTATVRTSYGNCNHVWIALADGRVLDPTADQFNDEGLDLPPVYLGKKIRKLHRNSNSGPPTTPPPSVAASLSNPGVDVRSVSASAPGSSLEGGT